MSDLRDRITADPDVDLDAVRSAVAEYAERGAYQGDDVRTAREEMEGAIASRIGAQFGGWDKYSHLDDVTREALEREIWAIASDIADDVETMVGDL